MVKFVSIFFFAILTTMSPIFKTTKVIDEKQNCQLLSSLENGNNSGETLLFFLHGWGGSAKSWHLLWSHLANCEHINSCRLIALDLPGFGDSPSPEQPWDVGAYALCVVKYLQQQNYKHLYIISHSFGGRLATKISAEFGRLVQISGLIYIAPAGIKHFSLIRKISKPAKKIICFLGLNDKFFFRSFKKIFYKIIGAHDYLKTEGIMRLTLQKILTEDLTPLLAKINLPTLIIWGKKDSYVPVRDGYKMMGLIPNGQLAIIKDGRHAIHQTHADIIAKKICQFIIQL